MRRSSNSRAVSSARAGCGGYDHRCQSAPAPCLDRRQFLRQCRSDCRARRRSTPCSSPATERRAPQTSVAATSTRRDSSAERRCPSRGSSADTTTHPRERPTARRPLDRGSARAAGRGATRQRSLELACAALRLGSPPSTTCARSRTSVS